MENIKVKKAKLLEILRKNKQEHKEIFLEALEGYRKQVVKLLEERLERVKNGKNFDLYFHLTQPVDQTKDYERAIGMLEMSLGDDVELSEMDYQQYVLDDWNWKTNFLTSNAFYSQKAAATVAATMTTSA